jgi:hypothetical protein
MEKKHQFHDLRCHCRERSSPVPVFYPKALILEPGNWGRLSRAVARREDCAMLRSSHPGQEQHEESGQMDQAGGYPHYESGELLILKRCKSPGSRCGQIR